MTQSAVSCEAPSVDLVEWPFLNFDTSSRDQGTRIINKIHSWWYGLRWHWPKIAGPSFDKTQIRRLQRVNPLALSQPSSANRKELTLLKWSLWRLCFNHRLSLKRTYKYYFAKLRKEHSLTWKARQRTFIFTQPLPSSALNQTTKVC